MELESHQTQKLNDGYGPPYHRIYSVKVKSTPQKMQHVLKKLKADLNGFSPQLLARFEKVTGDQHELKKGDEYMIHITGPWDGPVRVADVTDHSFKLVTLEGHLEAGEINFEIKSQSEGEYVFEIESVARSRDAVVDLVYDKIPIAKLAQTEMWSIFCKNFAGQFAEGEEKIEPEINILTERFDKEAGQWKKM